MKICYRSTITVVNRDYTQNRVANLRVQTYGAKAGTLSRLKAANWVDSFDLFAIKAVIPYHCMMSSRLAPASRFSKMADIGVRVPFNPHAPLTLPGTLSTAGHSPDIRRTLRPIEIRHGWGTIGHAVVRRNRSQKQKSKAADRSVRSTRVMGRMP